MDLIGHQYCLYMLYLNYSRYEITCKGECIYLYKKGIVYGSIVNVTLFILSFLPGDLFCYPALFMVPGAYKGRRPRVIK